MDEAQTRFVLDHFGNEALPVVMAEQVSREGFRPRSPRRGSACLRRRDPDASRLQDGCIANLEASPGGTVDVIDLDSGHNAMISQPAGAGRDPSWHC